MTLRRIALPLMGALTLGALPASAGMLSFSAPDGNVSTTASFAEGGVTIKVCGYTYARFGNSEGSPQSGLDVERLASLLGIDGSDVDSVTGGHASTTRNANTMANGHSGDDDAFGGSFTGTQGWGGGGAGSWGNGPGLADLFDNRNNGSAFGNHGFPSGGPWGGPWGPFDPPGRPHWPKHHDDDDSGPEGGGTTHMPEPATLALLGSGLLASGLVRRRKPRS